MEPDALDTLYDLASHRPGWLAGLLDAGLTPADAGYLVWRDECDAPACLAVKALERMPDDLPDTTDSLQLLNSKIDAIIEQSKQFSREESHLFLELSEIGALDRQKASIKARIMRQLEPNLDGPSESDIERARAVPLERLIPNLPKNRFIKCPYHRDKSPSFYVKGFGYCYACGDWEDAIKWEIDTKGLTFHQAVLSVVGH